MCRRVNNHKRCKSQTENAGGPVRRTVKSALKADHCNTDDTNNDSFNQIKDYSSIKHSMIYMVPKKNVVISKNNKIKRVITKKKPEKSNY